MSTKLAPDEEGVVALSFSANMQYVRPVRHFIQALCKLSEYGEEEVQEIQLVATEILNNSIEHGSGGPEDEIAVLLRVTRLEFHFEVKDPGRGGAGFAEAALDRAQQMPDLEQPRGRGLYLIQRFVDVLDVQWSKEHGTCTVIRKTREP
ncbi:MAG: ATP-binding protein [Planctomycetota bacterium]